MQALIPHLELFRHEAFGRVRVLQLNNELWFVARDVAQAIGYSRPQNAIARHCPNATLLNDKNFNKISGTATGLPESLKFLKPISVIPESDVYEIIAASNLPSTRGFKDWLFGQVIPSIRKEGYYSVNEKAPQPKHEVFAPLVEDYKAAKFFATEFGYKDTHATMMAVQAVKSAHSVDLTSYIPLALPSKTQELFITPTEIGYRLNCSAIKANRALEAAGLQNITRGVPGYGNRLGRIIWKITEEGEEFGKYFDVPILAKDGTTRNTIQRIKWRESVVPVLKEKLDNGMKVRSDPRRGKGILTLVGEGSKKTVEQLRAVPRNSGSSKKS